jgi:hypothetical protein
MAADMSGEQMQAKITACRREAEGLKDKIKRRKDELGDTSRTLPLPLTPFLAGLVPLSPTDSVQCAKSHRTRLTPYLESG